MPATFFTKDDHWVEIGDDGLATIGLTGRAVAALGAITALDLPDSGRSVVKGEICCTLRGATALTVPAPLTGTITETNIPLLQQPDLMTQSPSTTWLFKLRLADPGAFTELLDRAAYDALTATPQPRA